MLCIETHVYILDRPTNYGITDRLIVRLTYPFFPVSIVYAMHWHLLCSHVKWICARKWISFFIVFFLLYMYFWKCVCMCLSSFAPLSHISRSRCILWAPPVFRSKFSICVCSLFYVVHESHSAILNDYMKRQWNRYTVIQMVTFI